MALVPLVPFVPFVPLLVALSISHGAVDSVRVLRSARSEQASFEAFRRGQLPTGAGMSEPCDVHLGRYCYWRGDGEEEQSPPVDPPRVIERRDALLRMLDSASVAVTGDPWIAGQRVRYLLEGGRTDEALGYAARECRASAWWCAALEGYAAHVDARFARAESAYTRSVNSMDRLERCRWLDVSELLSDEQLRRYKPLDCAHRESFARRLFWIGAPLYSVSETDRLTEHLARVTRARIAERSAATDGVSWGDDTRALVMRYGWSRWYTRTLPGIGSMSPPSYTGHDVGTPYDFLIGMRGFDAIGHLRDDDWGLENTLAANGYGPSYARTLHGIPHQLAAFRRGDSTQVVAAWDVRRDTALIGRALDAALVIAGDGAIAAIARHSNEKSVGRMSVTALIDSGLVSLELIAPADRRAARTRTGVPGRARGRVALSDLLLYAPGDISTNAPPVTLDAVRDSALASDVIRGSRGVGVFWETYGLSPSGEAVQFTLSVMQIDVGWMQRTAEHLRLADPTRALSIQWSEALQPLGGIASRGVRVDLSRLRPGRYRMQVMITAGSEAPVVAVKEVEVGER
jgi:hypothetical protein